LLVSAVAASWATASSAIGAQFARCANEVANPYNALQAFTTNACHDAELCAYRGGL
jgi:hypothetical protein